MRIVKSVTAVPNIVVISWNRAENTMNIGHKLRFHRM